jgi:hypothetical protein
MENLSINKFSDALDSFGQSLAGFAGGIWRGNPDGFTLTDGLRWGIGAGFPTRSQLRFTADGKSLVFVVRADRVEQRAITVGVADGDAVEVASGLSGGEQVVMDPPATLADGAKVAVKER